MQPAVEVGSGGGTRDHIPFVAWRSTRARARYWSTVCGAQSSEAWKSKTGWYMDSSCAGSAATLVRASEGYGSVTMSAATSAGPSLRHGVFTQQE